MEPRIHHAYHKGDWVGAYCDPGDQKVQGNILVIDSGDTAYLFSLRDLMPDCRILLRHPTEDVSEIFFRSTVDAVVLGHSARHPALETLRLFKAGRPSVPVVVLAEQGSESLAVEVFRSGARDYFSKPLRSEEVESTLRALLTIRQDLVVRRHPSSTTGFEKALQFISVNFRSQLSLAQVAEKSGMSVSSFVRFFKKKTGMTFVDYLNSLRIFEACKLLRDPGQSVLQISMRCGFNNQSHFNRVFKKSVGVSPGKFKKSIQPHLSF